MGNCLVCGRRPGLFGPTLNPWTGRCERCEEGAKQAFTAFRDAFARVVADKVITPEEWLWLQGYATQLGLKWSDALQVVRPAACHYVEHVMLMAAADGEVTDDEYRRIQAICRAFDFQPETTALYTERLDDIRRMSWLRAGNLPRTTPPTNVFLEAGDACHFASAADQWRKRGGLTSGHLVASSARLRWVSDSGGYELPWKSVQRVTLDNPVRLVLEATRKSACGVYHLKEAETAEAIFVTLLRRDRRELVKEAGAADRRIPRAVRLEVWQRDEGRCVECSATEYLEFDHIIPFSLGGGNTVKNVQLLCRGCNLKKSNRL